MKNKNQGLPNQMTLDLSPSSEVRSFSSKVTKPAASVISFASASLLRKEKEKRSEIDRILIFAKEISW